jgi:hypothetical protein
MLKNPIQRNHDANNVGGGNNAGTDVSSLMDDDDVVGKPAANATSTEPAKIDKPDGNNSSTATNNTPPASSTTAPAKADDTQKDKPAETPKAVTVDDVTYQLNDKGDAVDKDGKIVKTKEELDTLEDEQEDELPLVDELLQKSGREILDDKGKPKKFPDTIEGILELTNDLADDKAKEAYEKRINRHPAAAEFVKYLERGGDPAEYFKAQSTAWSNFKFDEKNDDHLTNAIVAELVSRGIPKDQAEFTAQTYKDTSKLKDFGKAAYQRLVKTEVDARAAKEQQDLQITTNEAIKEKQYWDSVQEVVKKGKLNNVTIPETDRENFYNYVAIGVNEERQSQAEIDANKLPIEQQLQLSYLVYSKFDLGKLLTNAVKTERAKSLRDRTRTDQKGLGGGESVDKSQFNKTTDADISLDTIM